MLRRKRDENIGIGGADRRRIAVGEIDSAVRQSNVVDDAGHFGTRDVSVNRVLDFVAKKRGIFNAHPGGRSQMQFEAAGIDAGEEVLAQPWDDDGQRSQTRREEGYQKGPAMLETTLQQVAITFTHPVEGSFESLLDPHEHIAARSRPFVRSVVAKKV